MSPRNASRPSASSARQPVPPEEVRRLYWGSHNYHDTLAVTTFGDHAAVPRVGLPDQYWGMKLDALTPRKYGVPLSHSFYPVWHYIFGIANRELVAAGFFADPYDPGRRFQGFLPAVYRLNVVQGRF